MRRNLEFNGWGSKLLFEFLASIGKETAKKLTEEDVVAIVAKYCADQRLSDPENKNRILCDPKLCALFSRKWINKSGIYKHVEKHLAESQSNGRGAMEIEGEVRWSFEVGEGSGGNSAVSGEKRKRNSRPDEAGGRQRKGKEVLGARKRLFASVVANNIKFVYLRRDVLLKLLMKEPASFEAKVVGCFVRIKADPYYDFCRRSSHLLVRVKGVKRSQGNVELEDSVLLEVSCVLEDVPISKVSDDNFTKDECEDLRQRVKEGLLKRPLVADFQEKARSLHEFIETDSIVREVAIMNHFIARGNEEGWRKNFAKDWATYNNIKTPEDLYRLVKEIPKIIADEEEVEPARKELPRHEEQVVILQPEKVMTKAKPSECLTRAGTWSPGNVMEATGNVIKSAETSLTPAPTASLSPDDNVVEKSREEVIQKAAANTEKDTPAAVPFAKEKNREKDAPNSAPKTVEKTNNKASQKAGTSATRIVEIIDLSDDDDNARRPAAPINNARRPPPINNARRPAAAINNARTPAVPINNARRPAAPINNQPAAAAATATAGVNTNMWHCKSEKGMRLGGLYPISQLKKWMDSSPNPSGLHFKVWKEGQREEEAIWLSDAIRGAYMV